MFGGLLESFKAFIGWPTGAGDGLGQFQGRLVTEWNEDGRRMTLIEPFGFLDANHEAWDVPAGAVVDGASIPESLWSVAGAPFAGRYRKASVIHDYYCDTRERAWEKVHRVFYDAMLVSGVSERRAKVMYAAVYHFGPRWEALDAPVPESIAPVPESNAPSAPPAPGAEGMARKAPRMPSAVPPRAPSAEQFRELAAAIQSQDLSLEQIERFGAGF